MVAIWLWILMFLAVAEELVVRCPVTELQVGQTVEIEVQYIDIPVTDRPTLAVDPGMTLRYKTMKSSAIKDDSTFKTVITFTYVLTAKEEGVWNVGPASLAGRGLSSNTSRVLVKPFVDGKLPPLELTATVAKQTMYEGETFLYTVQFLSRLRLFDPTWRFPNLSKFSSIAGIEREQTQYTVIEKEQSIEVFHWHIPLLASNSGTYELSPTALSTQVVVASAEEETTYGLISGLQQQTIYSDSLAIEVKALPEPPDTFSGLVGEFTLRTELTKKQIAVGESVLLQIVIQGNGVISGVDIPAEVGSFRVYDDQPKVSKQLSGGSLSFSYTLNRALVPIKEGEFSINAIELVVFDPKEERYVTLRSVPQYLVVNSAVETSTIIQFAEKDDGSQGVTGIDILPARKDVVITTDTKNWVFVMVVIPFLLGLVSVYRFISPLKKLEQRKLPSEGRERLIYYLYELDVLLARKLGVSSVQPKEYTKFPDFQQVRQEIMSVLYGGQKEENIEERINHFFKRQR
jgi:hypothetical protein